MKKDDTLKSRILRLLLRVTMYEKRGVIKFS